MLDSNPRAADETDPIAMQAVHADRNAVRAEKPDATVAPREGLFRKTGALEAAGTTDVHGGIMATAAVNADPRIAAIGAAEMRPNGPTKVLPSMLVSILMMLDSAPSSKR